MHVFEPKTDEVTGDFRELLKENFHNLQTSQNIIIVTRLKRMTLAKHVAHMGEI
jgi:hypothetical protein